MLKKSLLALAAVVALAGFTTVTDPAAAQGMHRPPFPQMHGPGGHVGPMHGGPRVGGFHQPRPGPMYRPYPRHHYTVRPWVAPAIGLYSPGVYGYYDDDCRIVRKRVRVLTDHGWRLRWRSVRTCY